MSKEIKVALLAIVALVALYFGFQFLRGSELLSSNRTYFAKYANVDGLTVGNAVMLNGIKVGQVKEMQLLPKEGNSIRVAIEMNKDIVVGDSTVASLSGSLLGSKTITLFMGKNSKMYNGGEELKSYTVASITDAFQAKALPVLGTVDSTLIKINGFLNADSKQSVQQTLANAQGTTEALKNLILMNQRNVNKITGNVSELTSSLKLTMAKVDKLANNLSAITDTLKGAPIGQTIADLNVAVTDAKGAITRLNEGITSTKGSLGKLINDDSLYANLNATTMNANALMVDLKANPKRYVHFSVFGGGSKESKKKTETTIKPNGEVEKEVKTKPATGMTVPPRSGE
ncbi:MlaD family protein [Hymenobacter sp. BT175]|uniref:MlaD family protein n=1 Tax=Hymenobacter translucens TaxID=2886507 RepID=UPI001D0DE43B|nr:MlaD family protein [Hymenobacter translucens]MCC2546946.1 MlaD family protein [Hymenobacter translucens]